MLIVTTSYLVLFSRPLSEVSPVVALFVAAYLASNVAAHRVLPRLRSPAVLDWTLVAVDTVALTVAVVLTGSGIAAISSCSTSPCSSSARCRSASAWWSARRC